VCCTRINVPTSAPMLATIAAIFAGAFFRKFIVPRT